MSSRSTRTQVRRRGVTEGDAALLSILASTL